MESKGLQTEYNLLTQFEPRNRAKENHGGAQSFLRVTLRVTLCYSAV